MTSMNPDRVLAVGRLLIITHHHPRRVMELYYNRYGDDGHPLIILHGLLGASGNWHTLSRTAFSEVCQVYALDQRNHGRSPHSDVFDYPSMADDVAAFARRHRLSSFHLLGHSMGGKTAMEVALSHPEWVDKLVVVDVAPKAYPPQHGYIFDALRALDLDAYDARSDIDDALAEKIGDRRVRQFLLKNVTYDGDSKTYEWQMNLDVIYRNYDKINVAIENGRTFEGPTLFVRGEASDYVQDEDLTLIKALFPHAECRTIPGAGHWLHADQPEAFADVVMGFLKT